MSSKPKLQPRPPRRPHRAKRSSRLTLRQRLTLSLMLVGMASLALAGTVYIAFDMVGFRQKQLDRLELQATLVTTWIDEHGFPDRPTGDLGWSEHLQSDVHVRRAELNELDGSLLSSYNRSRVDGSSSVPPVIQQMWKTAVRRDVYVGAKPVGYLHIVGSPEPFWVRIKNHAGIVVALVGVSALITLGLARRINRRFSDQILDLAHAANAISMRQDYSIRVVRRSDDELGILVDTFNHMITQIELRDLQLKAEVSRAEAAKIAKAEFLATMSHEIRTPINGILGMTELLEDTEQSSEQVEFTKAVRRSADGLLSIINDILDFSKGEAGRLELETIPFSLTTVFNECLETVSIAACEKDIELCCRVDRAVPPSVLGDPSRLRQVLLNLLSNALKFTNDGEVVLRASLEEQLGDDVEVRIEVQDTGIGIPEERLERLFRSFSQVDASNTRKYGGTGLGLAICKQIVEAMGGSVYVRTMEGEGSTFGFRIRLRVDQKEVVVEPKPSPTGLRILIADANRTSREALAYMLEEDNRITAVGTGLEARVNLMRAHETLDQSFDLILMDARLAEDFAPGNEDREYEMPDVPLVLLAPVTQLTSAASVKWKGRTACLARPAKRDELFWCLEEVLRPDGDEPRAPFAMRKMERPDVTGVRVLVAEDHPVNQKITTRFLDKLGVEWGLVENGEEVVAALEEGTFDLVLMDVQMPVMDGIEATLKIRELELETNEHIPIVAMSANALEQDKRRCFDAGFDDYLVKPVRLEQLRNHIFQWTTGRMAA